MDGLQNNVEKVEQQINENLESMNEVISDVTAIEIATEEENINAENIDNVAEMREASSTNGIEKEGEENKGNDIEMKVDTLVEQVAILNDLFEKKMLVDGQKNKIIELQGDELQKLREGLYEKILKPLLCDVIDIADDIHRMLRAYASKSEETVQIEKFMSVLEIYESDIEDILGKYGVDVYSCPEELFNPQKQKIVKIVQTDDADKNRCVAERITKGFALDGKMIRPERVNVYKYQEQENSQEEKDN